jgi:hypothetical protein
LTESITPCRSGGGFAVCARKFSAIVAIASARKCCYKLTGCVLRPERWRLAAWYR